MKITETEQQLVAKDSPGCMWLFASLFIGIGGLFVVGPLFFNSDRLDQPWYANLIAMLIGAAVAAAGVGLLARTPTSTVVFDRRAYQVVLRQGWRASRRDRTWSWNQVARVLVGEGQDDEGRPVYRLQLVLQSDERVWLSKVFTHGREELDRAVEAVERFTGWTQAGEPQKPMEGMGKDRL